MSSELTYQERQMYSTQQIEDEMQRLGIPTHYPREDEFSETEINTAIGLLTTNYLYEEAATLMAGEHSPAVLTAFAALAKALGANIFTENYGRMIVRTPTSDEKRREAALSNLRSGLNQKRRDRAIRSLMGASPVDDTPPF